MAWDSAVWAARVSAAAVALITSTVPIGCATAVIIAAIIAPINPNIATFNSIR